MLLFSKKLIIDSNGKATNFRLHSLKYPHMRALHLAWISFMTAFMAWYAIPPLMPHIAKDLKISAAHVYDSNVAAVSATTVARLVVGPLCERYGPRRVMAGLLLTGAIPSALPGVVKNASGLIGLRFMIGIMGATFVPTQFWTTQMFAPSVVGTANAITGGWGNMGAGVTYLLMPAIHDGIRHHLPERKTWRVVFVIPSGICILVAILVLLFSTDTPHGDWLKLREQNQEEPAQEDSQSGGDEKEVDDGKEPDEKGGIVVAAVTADGANDEEIIKDVKRDETPLEALVGFFKVLSKPSVLIMVCVYACSFGVELAIDNVIGRVFQTKFKLKPSTAAYIGSIFGLMNLFSRLSGGLFSDFAARHWHMPGRILALLGAMLLEGAFLLGFSFGLVSLSTSIILMVFFSFFVQHICGSTFAIVPFIDPENNGKVMGIVGAGGSLGGLIFNLMFRGFGDQYSRAFLCLGCICLGVAALGCSLLKVQGKTVWHLYNGRRM